MLFKHPYFILLLFLPLLFYFFKGRKFYLRHPYVNAFVNARAKIKLDYKILNWMAFVLLCIAAVHIYWKIVEVQHVKLVHKYILVNDASGSMLDLVDDRGISPLMDALLNANSKFLQKIKKGEDYVGLILFSSDAFVASDLIDDPNFIRSKLVLIDYRAPPLGQGTNIHDALWSAVLMSLGQKENPNLEVRFYGEERTLKDDDYLKKLVKEKSSSTKGTSIILFTDGMFPDLDGRKFGMSVFKILEFCRLMQIRVYFISVSDIDPAFETAIKKTQGDVTFYDGNSNVKLDKVYEKILDNQANEMVTKEEQVDSSISDILAAVALLLLFIALVMQNTVNRNFTEV